MAQVRKDTIESRKAAQVEAVRCDNGKVCLPPCQIGCPVDEDIQRTNVMISCLPPDEKLAHDLIIKIGDEIYEKNPLFPLCSYFCGLCEKQCNYKDETGAIRRRLLKRFLIDEYMPYLDTKAALPEPTGEKVAIIGGGPGGLMAAYVLAKKGYQPTIFEKGSRLGGAIRWAPPYRLPSRLVD